VKGLTVFFIFSFLLHIYMQFFFDFEGVMKADLILLLFFFEERVMSKKIY